MSLCPNDLSKVSSSELSQLRCKRHLFKEKVDSDLYYR